MDQQDSQVLGKHFPGENFQSEMNVADGKFKNYDSITADFKNFIAIIKDSYGLGAFGRSSGGTAV